MCESEKEYGLGLGIYPLIPTFILVFTRVGRYSHSYSLRYSLIRFVIRVSFVSSLSRMKYLATVNSIRISLALPSSLCAASPPLSPSICPLSGSVCAAVVVVVVVVRVLRQHTVQRRKNASASASGCD